MFRKLSILLILILAMALVACGGDEEEPAEEPLEEVTLTIESWRNDDLAIWQDVIIPAFNAEHPNIEVIFAPAAPAEYNGVLNTKLEGGTAGDLITCRPFDADHRRWLGRLLRPHGFCDSRLHLQPGDLRRTRFGRT